MDGDNFAIRLGPALLLYPLMIAGSRSSCCHGPPPDSPLSAARVGGLLGLVGYGIYDLTNYATLAQYSLRMTVVDMVARARCSSR